MKSKFKDLRKDPAINDIDWTNQFYDFKKIFEGVKNVTLKSDTEACFLDPTNLTPEDKDNPTFVLQPYPGGMIKVCKENQFGFDIGTFISKFTLLCKLSFGGDATACASFISFHERKKRIPYMRVGVDYFKLIYKENRYGANNTLIKPWSKDEIKQDHDSDMLKIIDKWDDFTIVPNNLNFSPSYKNCYNLYSEFPHKPSTEEVTEHDIPVTQQLLTHIFGDQLGIGLKYMKILYEDPKQILPVLILVSSERETGKTTFLNWIQMIFGENSVLISPQELTSQFNSGYATKNIVMIDETVIEKSTSVEKLKSLATAKTISVSQKFVAQYSIPFFGKIIICTNKERDFMRVDEEEIRFWIRKIKPIDKDKKNTNIEFDLFNEIPQFLKYLTQQPAVDKSKSRMVFTMEEINTHELGEVKKESRSWLRKEIEEEFDALFLKGENDLQNQPFVEASTKDIKNEWFKGNHNVTLSYIRKVLKQEMQLSLSAPKVYKPFGRNSQTNPIGRVFRFENVHYNKDYANSDQNGLAEEFIENSNDESHKPF